MKRLLLHIGTGKTGTSSIQNFLFENRAQLASRFSVMYPQNGLLKIEHFGEVIYAHDLIVSWIRNRETTSLQKLVFELNASDCNTIIVSCENLYHHLSFDNIAFLGDIFKDFSVEIICYVRRQDLYMESAWKQQVKVGDLKAPFPRFLQRHIEPRFLNEVHGNYYRMLKPWAATFGIDNIRVKVFDKSEWVNGNLIDDFLDTCHINVEQATFIKPAFTNLALPSELIRLLQKTNAKGLIQKEQQQDFVNYLSQLKTFNESRLLSTTDRLAIIKNYHSTNQALFSEFCQREIPNCFQPVSIENKEKTENTPQVSLEDIATNAIVAAWKQSNHQIVITQNLGIKTAKKVYAKTKQLLLKFDKKRLMKPTQKLSWPPQINEPLEYNPVVSAKEVVKIIKQHQSTQTPLSIIRLGDGESAVIGYPEHTPAKEFEHFTHWFFGENRLSPSQQLSFVQEVRDSVSHADIIGVVGGNQVTKFTAVRYLIKYHNLVNSAAKTTHLSLHRNLQELDLYKDFLLNLDEIGLITCRDIEETIKTTFKIGKVIVYKIPEEFKHAKDKETVKRHYPDRFEEIRATLTVPKPGMLFLVGAGPLGKIYCRWIKERGGIALDIGSVFDAWSGLTTRKFMENGEGLFNTQYALKN